VHHPAYVAAVRAAAVDPHFVDAARGLGTTDDPVFPNMHVASARVAGATVAAARAVHEGGAQHAVNLSGGLHHAMPGSAAGFCVYNDIGVAIAWLLDQGVERIAYVDVDVHHGDGVQAMFWDDPRVLTISIHESPRTLFPGTGFPTEIGGPHALGSAVNIALPAGTGDQGWLRAFHAVAPQVLEAFRPTVLVSQHGCDSHFDDPLAHLTKSLDGQRMAYEAVHRWAHRYAGGRWIAVGGGGYEWVDVVPRAWTHLIAEAAGAPIPPRTETPAGFREYVMEALGRPAPFHMTDGRDPWPKPFEQGFNPDDAIDGSILATRTAVFPYHGLIADPHHWF
jgi:acetoin utilization protein AcuC